ncbi:MAG TPA: beta-N-acetylhexosaminidase [Candidatus Nitrosotenuis sp.]|jgi:beta-N-acetylhexosaminidase|nr:beta-N-acetylhexosaminidase [Candidatus Nitrosotenuis sp.]
MAPHDPLEDKAARMVMIDLPGPQLDADSRRHVASAPWGGLVLFSKNIESRPQVAQLLEDFHQACPARALVAVDQEGGLVDRFRFEEMSNSPGNMALAATGDEELTRRAYRIMATELADLGVDLDFAPCLDVNCNPENPIIGVRSFGEDPDQVSRHGRAAIEGLRQGGVGATAKHFPGHGDTSQDSHIALPTLPHGRDRLERVELAPFRAAVEAGVEAIMTAHVTFPALDPSEGLPATLSRPVLSGLLRQAMGYRGVIATDSLSMKAISDHFGQEEAAVKAVEAGADLILALGPPSQQVAIVRALVQAVRHGRLTEARLDESLGRLSRLWAGFRNQPAARPRWDVAAHREEMAEIAARGITLVRNQEGLLPARPGPDDEILVLAPDVLPVSPLGEVSLRVPLAPWLRAEGAARVQERLFNLATAGPPVGELTGAARQASLVVLALYGRNRLPDPQKELARAIIEANPHTVVVSLSSPYLLMDVPQAPAYVCAYNYGPLSLQALARVLLGRRQPGGRLPVSLPGLYPAGHGLGFGASVAG